MSEGDEGVVFEQGEGTVARLKNRIVELERSLAKRQASLDSLSGAKFSDRVFAALKDRAEKAEEELAAACVKHERRVAMLEKALKVWQTEGHATAKREAKADKELAAVRAEQQEKSKAALTCGCGGKIVVQSVRVPCPDGQRGCLVSHWQTERVCTVCGNEAKPASTVECDPVAPSAAAAWDGLEAHALELLRRAQKAEEELSYVRRELAEVKGQDASEEASQTLAIYESFKTALEPFGHGNVNVRARIEALVEEWKNLHALRDLPRVVDQIHDKRFTDEIALLGTHIQSIGEELDTARDERNTALQQTDELECELEKWRAACETVQTQRDGLTETVRRMEQLILPLDPDPKLTKRMSEVIADVPQRVALILERTRAARRDRDEALMLLADALIQLQYTGASTFLIRPAVSDGAKRDLIRVLKLSMGEDTVEDAPSEIGTIAEAKEPLGVGDDVSLRRDTTVKRPGVGVGVVCFQDGKILLGKRHPNIDGGGQWQLPGGSVEWGEEWEVTARREMREETGLTDLQNYRVVTVKADFRPQDAKHNAVIFVRFDAKGPVCVMEPDKSTEWGWYSLDKLPEGPMFPALHELLTTDRHLLV